MGNVLQGKGAPGTECNMKNCNVKSAQCEEKQQKRRTKKRLKQETGHK